MLRICRSEGQTIMINDYKFVIDHVSALSVRVKYKDKLYTLDVAEFRPFDTFKAVLISTRRFSCCIGFKADMSVQIWRKEIYDRRRNEYLS